MALKIKHLIIILITFLFVEAAFANTSKYKNLQVYIKMDRYNFYANDNIVPEDLHKEYIG